MAEVVWNANGQGEFDFDYLLNLTDQNFCDFVSKQLDNHLGAVKVIKVVEMYGVVRVTAVTLFELTIYRYWKHEKLKPEYDSITITDNELLWAMEVMQNEK